MQGRKFRIAIASAAALLMLALGAGTLVLLERMRQTAQATTFDTVERSARVVETAVNRHLLAVDGMLAGLPAILGALPRTADGAPSSAAVSRALRDLNFQNFTFRDLMLVGADGRVWASALPASRNRPLPLDAKQLAAAGQPGAVAILGPSQNANTGEWAIFLARTVTIAGIGPSLAVAEVPVSLITMLLGPYGEAKTMRLTVERTGGLLLAGTPHDEGRMGRPLGPLPSAEAPDGIARLAQSRFDQSSIYRAVRPTLYQDLYVTASIDVDAALADWRRDRNGLIAAMVVLGTMLGGFAIAINLALRQRERNEAERTHARQVLENAIESLSDGFVMFDADDRLVVCNQRYRDFYAVTGPFVVPGIKFSDMIREGAKRGQYPQAGEDIEAFVQEIQAWHKGNHPPMERLLPDGRWVLVTERGTPDGGTVGIRTDITALKHAMAGLAAARDQAAAATEAKSRFLARMSHELRTPLNGVLGLAQALADDPTLAEGARARARTLEMSGRHLLAVANDALDLARIETGRLELQPTTISLQSLLDSCLTMLRPAARHHDVDVALVTAPDLPRQILADETRLRQILLNLLSNALKFSPERGRVELRCSTDGPPDAAGRRPLRFEVRDEGPGVPEDQRAAIFGDFVQIERSGAPDGAGLGLAIAAYLVDRMAGRIGCSDNSDSRTGSGALFWVEVAFPGENAPVMETPVVADAADAARHLRILVADDVPANLMVARALLETAGHKVDTVPDGERAVEAMAAVDTGTAAAYDAVLMDVMMPRLNGLEATKRIRALPGQAAAVPIIAVTASAYPEDVAACREAGMDDHVVKPIDRESLLRKLAALADAPRMAAQRPVPPTAAPGDAFDALPLLREIDGAIPRLSIPGLDEAMARRLVPEFLREIRTTRDELRQVDLRSIDAVISITHRLAGSAATLGAERLTAASRAFETAAKQARSGGGQVSAVQRQRVLEISAETLEVLEATLSVAPAAE